MSKHVLLVEPDYYTQFPPIGLLKLSTYYKNKGYTTELIRGCKFPEKEPHIIHVTSLFTWMWRPVWRAVNYYQMWYPKADSYLGGIYASLMPSHAAESGVDHVLQGLCAKLEDLMPDYSLRPKWDGSIVFSSRGCNRRCGFCAVPQIEGHICLAKKSITPFIWPGHTKIIFFDNNFLLNPYYKDVFDELDELDMKVDFNQGIDARLINSEIADRLASLQFTSSIRIAYDAAHEKKAVEKAIRLLADAGVKKRKILVYTLFNYEDNPENFLNRVINILNWGAVCYPMRYEPLNALEKNQYISPKWHSSQVEAVQAARRVIGYGGAFPPYQGLIKKLSSASNFDEAFELREPNGGHNR